MTEDANQGVDVDKMAAFATDILAAQKSGVPFPHPEQVIAMLAEMVIALAEYTKTQLELCAEARQAADGLAWMLYHPDPRPRRGIRDA